jgi:hypothetical protein
MMTLRHVAALTLAGWIVTAQIHKKPGIYLEPGVWYKPPPKTEYKKHSDCDKAAAEYRKDYPIGWIVNCVEK